MRIKSGREQRGWVKTKLALSISEMPNLSFRYVLQLLRGLAPLSRQLLPVPDLQFRGRSADSAVRDIAVAVL